MLIWEKLIYFPLRPDQFSLVISILPHRYLKENFSLYYRKQKLFTWTTSLNNQSLKSIKCVYHFLFLIKNKLTGFSSETSHPKYSATFIIWLTMQSVSCRQAILKLIFKLVPNTKFLFKIKIFHFDTIWNFSLYLHGKLRTIVNCKRNLVNENL